MVKLCIRQDNRTKLRIGLIKNGVLGDNWYERSIEPVVTLSATSDFVNSMIDIMPNDESKAKVVHVFKDSTFPFAYDVKDTTPGEFPDPGHVDVKKFRPDTKVAVEVQVHAQNFKSRGGDKGIQNQGNLGYSFRRVGIYKLQDIKVLPPSTPEKRRKEAEE